MSTDMLHETTDFPTGMTDYECGWMAAAVTLSDVASMGGPSPLPCFWRWGGWIGLTGWKRSPAAQTSAAVHTAVG